MEEQTDFVDREALYRRVKEISAYREANLKEDEHVLSKIIHDFGMGLISAFTIEDVKKMIQSEVIPDIHHYSIGSVSI